MVRFNIPRSRRALARCHGYSGVLVGPEHLGEVQNKPPVLLVHGDQDEVIPLDALFMSAEALAKAELPCQFHLSFGIGHGIDGGGLLHGGLFLTQSLTGNTPEPPRGAMR